MKNTAKHLPVNILARWDSGDWNENSMTASRYRYTDIETSDPVELTEAEADLYIWGQTEDNITGGTQSGRLAQLEKQS